MIIFRAGRGQSQNAPEITGVAIQTSILGRTIPVVFGTTKIAPNLIWYDDFVKLRNGRVVGGKGGLFRRAAANETYQTALIFALCHTGEDPNDAIAGVDHVLIDNGEQEIADLALTLFDGSDNQSPWGYLTANHPTKALNYRHIAYAAASAYQLGGSASLPNHQFVIQGLKRFDGSTIPDADPSEIIPLILSDGIIGAGFPSARIGALTDYQNFVRSHGLFVSLAMTDQRSAARYLEEIAAATFSEWIDSAGTLKLIPRGDTAKTGNGATYTPPGAAVFDLGVDDFSPDPDGPVRITRKRAADVINLVKLEVWNRSNRYSPEIVEARDQARIDLYGLKAITSQSANFIVEPSIGRTVVQFALQREALQEARFAFGLDGRFAMLEPMDIVTLTEPSVGLDHFPVRILSIEEADDEFTLEAEPYPAGVGSVASYSFGTSSSFSADYNSTPDNAVEPVIFEPPHALAGALEVWIATNGAGDNWGGAEVWASTDGENYRRIGEIRDGANIGELTATLPAVTQIGTSAVLDEANTLAVLLSGTGGELISSSESDALALNPLAYVDGELLAFASATMTAAYEYDLEYLVRGAYGTVSGSHAIGSRFADLTSGVLRYAFTADRIGQTVNFKFLSFNKYGGGLQSLADVSPYSYTITGAALSYSHADIADFRSAFIDGRLWLTWTEIEDFRAVWYEIRKGADWEGAQTLGIVAHPPIPTSGDGTYWIAARSQPTDTLVVYSGTPASLVLTNTALISNVIAEHDEKDEGWTGTISAGLEVDGDDLRTEEGETAAQTYTIPTGNRVILTAPAACAVTVSWTIVGQFWEDAFLDRPDFLGTADFLGIGATALVDGYPEMRLSQDGSTWGDWIRYAPGVYLAQGFDFRMVVHAPDEAASSYLTAFVFSVDVPDRIDHRTNLSLASGGTAITFRPDGAGSDAAFNGGPNGAVTPNIQVTVRGGASGDTVLVTSISLSGCTIQVLDAGGAGVARTVDVIAQGY